MATLFESETCSRCGGSGHYSYCSMYGTVCFKCHGKKVTLTKRGAAAQALYTKLASKPNTNLVAGDQIWFVDGVFGKSRWITVKSITPDQHNAGYIVIDSDGAQLHEVPGTLARVRLNAEQRAAVLDVCVAFERSLNKQGKVDKSLARLAKQVAY